MTRLSEERERQREQEIERGRVISARAQRVLLLDRYVAGRKVLAYADIEAGCTVHEFIVAGVVIGREAFGGEDYPSEALMAKIALAVAATVGTEGIPPAQTIDPIIRAQRDEYRARMQRQVGRE